MIRPFTTFSLSISELVNVVGGRYEGPQNIVITGAAHTDQDVQVGDIFLAYPGKKFHGAQFAESALKNGAVAILTDSAGAEMTGGAPTIIVDNPRVAGATIAATLYRSPMRTMESIGITGTNGKTTVTTLLYQIMTAVGRESGLIGTVETRIGAEVIPSVRTTPEASEIQALAATMLERHVRHCIMEVSSHALEEKRMIGSFFQVVGFTNLSQDHLDYHHTMESYFAAKAKLFTFEYADLGFINIDNEYGFRLANQCEIPTITVSRASKKATWHYLEIEPEVGGTQFSMRGRDGVLIESRTKLHGGFNLDNLLLATAIAYQCGVDPLQLAQIIPTLSGAAGRLEPVNVGQDFSAFVDYAHSPDAVVNALKAVREFTPGRVIAVLGCGGDRDSSKRSLMGEALAQGSDIAIFTSDNPRSEDPAAILSEMVSTVAVAAPSAIIAERRAAIAYAISLAQSGDTVVVLGKGHETGQEISGVKHPFDDRLILAQLIEDRA